MAKDTPPKPSPAGKPPAGGGGAVTKAPKEKAQDDQVMATNSSSIASKRSVEKFYYPDEPHFFRYFVSKLQRRSPLINRGYHLRLHVIDVLVRNFLRSSRDTKCKVVVNLGCGSDVLPWQCLTRYPEHCTPPEKVKFVDVDFPDLIQRKRATVLNTPELKNMFPGLESSAGPVVLKSDQYYQVGCDLRYLDTLQSALAEIVGGDIEECSFLFVAEVSITYMETAGADNVIRWASTVGDAEFVLLEQILPDGPGHPFASTMLTHFNKLNTPPKSVHVYPTLDSQTERFKSRGWRSVDAWTLWQAWADSDVFLSDEERKQLEEVEAFDEWEEFAIFGSHYCLVHARTISPSEEKKTVAEPRGVVDVPVKEVKVQYDEVPGQRGQRRFGAALSLTAVEGSSVEDPVVVNVMGLGTKSRLSSCDVYTTTRSEGPEGGFAFKEGGPASRMCHSLTDLDGGIALLAGGRGSPSTPMEDCWILEGGEMMWKRTHDLPFPLYRHSVIPLGRKNMALLLGGKGTDGVFGGCLLYEPDLGWIEVDIVGDVRPVPVYGAMLACLAGNGIDQFIGIYTGGLDSTKGVIADQVLDWELDITDFKKPTMKFRHLPVTRGDDARESRECRRLLTRFGASCSLLRPETLVIVGGVVDGHILHQQDEVLEYVVSEEGVKLTRRWSMTIEDGMPRPLLVGNSTAAVKDRNLLVLGGGATCFSMGTFWNKGVYTLHFDNTPGLGDDRRWAHWKTVEIVPGEARNSSTEKNATGPDSLQPGTVTPIKRVRLKASQDFAKVMKKGRPVVIEGLHLGSCASTWDLDYLVSKVGADRKVVIHESSTQAMDFNAKNFRYVTTEFGDFARRVGAGEKLYLRALSSEKPAEKPALLSEDFPALVPDFMLPPQLSAVDENLFSSVLRVSGPVNMWLHYDVMANVYCQVSGSKRLILFPPSDVEHLSFAPGASSSSIDVFASLGNSGGALSQTHPHEAVLSPGDVLYLPPLWLHTATMTPDSTNSIAVNVFFRHLEHSGSYAPGRDVYGNRDLAAYEKGRQDINRIAKSFQKLPAEAREFYLLRLADELRRKAR
ncbi:methyltransferase [Diplogelasinospora grovesii]|uniref:tRNA wybutosine-synthesizing protein 4 n=1 Tax=Diplogelasinospora grovesii TaxID=303347 RepID=A0AAN6NMB9_9PEZI|nr:methyltransferase [Diplogelasinospora grovesii]